MSALQRSFAKAQLQNLPPPPAVFDEAEEDAASEEHPPLSKNGSSSSASSTGTITASADKNLFERPTVRQHPRSQYEPLPWQNFFEQEIFLDGDDIRSHTYFTPPATAEAPLFCFHHGAGASGLSFALLTSALKAALPEAGFLSPDCRGHGQTTTATKDLDLSLETLATDLAFVVNATSAKSGWSKLPPVVLLGHSLGGAVVTELAHRKLLGNSVLGYGVLDVVEGSAMDALQSMEQYLSTRPRSFPSISRGIEWHVRSRTLRNSNSARVSVPPLLTQKADNDDVPFTWRTDLSATKPFWEKWFTGLSTKFLSVPGAGKLLILAGTDRLDKELMIGQMQGKYQLQVFPESGHFVHEDQPEKTAMVVADFFRRNDRSTLVLPPKVDDLIRQGKLKPVHQAK
ncbi:Protein phosphatase methylesterase 1 [Knufia obscura]|uniref:Protein phosphatase methylesterase 1 n=2 Tax=Knufia TaxID=430999 RepID=A0AAN8EWA5_9EURO|nr:Protein phosphatase methylesterase 1 [Knufia obscura]KAK5955096.1 Protein phosphatase methylesterase 1 [Knufia fluminis]